MKGDIELAEKCLTAGIKVNSFSSTALQAPPLLNCILNKQLAMTQWLLDQGADPLIYEDFDGKTLLEKAVFNSTEAIVKALQAKGAIFLGICMQLISVLHDHNDFHCAI